MRPIRLITGEGNGKDRACLATAVAMIAGVGEQTDHPDCLCPVIASFIHETNDAIGNHSLDLLGETYGDLPWELVGTATDDKSVMRLRAYIAADYAVRKFAPLALRALGLTKQAEALESLPQITDETSARAAADAAAEAAERAACVPLAKFSKFAVWAAFAAELALTKIGQTDAADAAAEAAARAALTAHAWPTIAVLCRQCILDMAAVGSRVPIEPCMTHDELAKVLQQHRAPS